MDQVGAVRKRSEGDQITGGNWRSEDLSVYEKRESCLNHLTKEESTKLGGRYSP